MIKWKIIFFLTFGLPPLPISKLRFLQNSSPDTFLFYWSYNSCKISGTQMSIFQNVKTDIPKCKDNNQGVGVRGFRLLYYCWFFENYRNTVIKFLYKYRHRSSFYEKLYFLSPLGDWNTEYWPFLIQITVSPSKIWQIANTITSYAPN